MNQSTLFKLTSDLELLEGYNLLPDILFWIKDLNGCIRHANTALIKHFGLHSLQQAIGKSDIDFYPEYIALQFIEDDKRVIRGEVILNRLELSMPQSGEAYWSITSKRPFYNQQEQIIGSYGVSRFLKNTESIDNIVNVLEKPIRYIQENYMYDINLVTLASVASLSVSALERRFKKHLHISPNQYLIKTRLENARKLLIDTSYNVTRIADETGFNDVSYFCKKFKQLFALTPNEFRNAYQTSTQE